VDGSLLNSLKLFLNSFKLFSSCLSEGIVPHRNTVLDNWAYNCAVKNENGGYLEDLLFSVVLRNIIFV